MNELEGGGAIPGVMPGDGWPYGADGREPGLGPGLGAGGCDGWEKLRLPRLPDELPPPARAQATVSMKTKLAVNTMAKITKTAFHFGAISIDMNPPQFDPQ